MPATAASVTMDTEVFDAIIVGAGEAGPTIAARCS
jgi:cation diffusion facilitator CzcD-associated flavoprotein CzcO